MKFPPAPELGSLRLARLADLPRIGVVAASAFFHSPMFGYERPYANQYPLDTLSSYRDSFKEAILDPDSVVLVAEHDLNHNESQSVYEALAKVYPSFEDQIPHDSLKKGRVVVSVSSFSLVPNSARHGQFLPEGSNPQIPEDKLMERDQNKTGNDMLKKFAYPKKKKAFAGRTIIDMMVTHPAYWHTGHATMSVEWYQKLASEDSLGIGVSAAPMGRSLFEKMGFKENQTIEIPGYEEHPDPIYAWLGLWASTEKDTLTKTGESIRADL